MRKPQTATPHVHRIPLIPLFFALVGQLTPVVSRISQHGGPAVGKQCRFSIPYQFAFARLLIPRPFLPQASLASAACPTIFPHCLTEAQITLPSTALWIRHSNASVTSVRPAKRVKEL